LAAFKEILMADPQEHIGGGSKFDVGGGGSNHEMLSDYLNNSAEITLGLMGVKDSSIYHFHLLFRKL
jgi:hypothetical protein